MSLSMLEKVLEDKRYSNGIFLLLPRSMKSLWKSKFCVKLNAIHQQNSKDGNLCIVLKYVRKQLRRFCLSIDNKQLRSYLHRRIKKKIYLKKMWLTNAQSYLRFITLINNIVFTHASLNRLRESKIKEKSAFFNILVKFGYHGNTIWNQS